MTSGKGVDDLINTLIKKKFKKISSSFDIFATCCGLLD